MNIPDGTCVKQVTTPLGQMLLGALDDRLVGAWFADQAHLPDLSGCARTPDLPVLEQAASELAQYFGGQRQRFDLPLQFAAGTAFQRCVWQALQGIGWGSTCSYGELARRIGRPTAVRAVASAVGRNPLGIIVPCHRVLGADGNLTGYAGGLKRKSALLQLESRFLGSPPPKASLAD